MKMKEGLIGKLKEKIWKEKVDLYFIRFSRKHDITLDYVVQIVNNLRYKNKKGD